MTILIIFIFGLLFGSFLNVVINRLHNGQSIVYPPSACPSCKKNLAWFDNIPVVSFLILKAKCRSCKSKISWQYPIIEVITGLIILWLYLNFGLTMQFLAYAIFSIFLIVIFTYDLKHYLILDSVVLPAAIIAFGFNLYLGISWQSLLLGVLIGAGFFGIQYFISKGKWIGGGDIRLGGLMGLMLGWKLLIVALFLSYIVGAFFGIILIMSGRKKMSSEVPFGTFLTLATLATFVYGNQILQWYLDRIF